MDQVEQTRTEALQALEAASSLEALESVRVATLGKKGSLTGLLKQLQKLAGGDPSALEDILGTLTGGLRGLLPMTSADQRRELSLPHSCSGRYPATRLGIAAPA